MAGGEGEHGGAVLRDESALDLCLSAALEDEALDEGALAVGLRGLGDGEGDFAGHAHHLPFDGGQRGADRARPGGERGGGEYPVECHGEQDQRRRAGRSHTLSESRRARSRNRFSTCPRQMATTRPEGSMRKLSGSWAVP